MKGLSKGFVWEHSKPLGGGGWGNGEMVQLWEEGGMHHLEQVVEVCGKEGKIELVAGMCKCSWFKIAGKCMSLSPSCILPALLAKLPLFAAKVSCRLWSGGIDRGVMDVGSRDVWVL